MLAETDGHAFWPRKISALLVGTDHCVDITLAAHDDWASVVNVFWHHLQNAPQLALEHASGCDATCLLGDHSHGEALVQHAELALGGLLVSWIQENTTIQKCTMNI